MYGMGAGPTSGRGTVLYLDDSYDVSGRTIANPPLRTGGRPLERESGGQLFGGAAPIEVAIETPAPLQTAVPAVVVSSAPVPVGDIVDTSFPAWPWYVWAGGIAGVWFLFRGRR